MTKTTPSLRHLSLASLASILSSLARSATTLQRLRQFVAGVFEQTRTRYPLQPQHRGGKSKHTRTLEAFADAVDAEIRALDAWCAAREEAMCRAWGGAGVIDENGDMQPLVISLLGTEKDVQDAFDRTFEVLLDVLNEVYPSAISNATRARSAALLSTMLLDRLFEKVQRYLERREEVTSEALMRVFVRTAEPMWAMTGKWLRDGMGLGMGMGVGMSGGAEELEDEFFIEGSGLGLGMMGMGLLDPEFWKEGYALREGVVFDEEDEGDGERRRKTIPQFLEHVAEPVLGAGKAVGLLRALGVPPSSSPAVGEWQTFGKLVGLSPSSAEQLNPEEVSSGDKLFSVSIDTLSRLIYDRLLPQCDVAGALMAQVLVDECALWTHLASIEDLYLMRRGDAISHFADVLFAKVRFLRSL
jgi:gamma-tubulin complex component 5